MTLHPATTRSRLPSDPPPVTFTAPCCCGLDVTWLCRPTSGLSGALTRPVEHDCAGETTVGGGVSRMTRGTIQALELERSAACETPGKRLATDLPSSGSR